MELVKDEKIQKEMKINKNENMPTKFIDSINNNINNLGEQKSCKNINLNKLNINEIRNYMINNKITESYNYLTTDINNNNNISFKDKNYESLESSNNNDFVMNQNYNYNSKSSNNNSSLKHNEFIQPNFLYISHQDEKKNNHNINNNNFQYYSEQKIFNPGLLVNFSTKKSTRSTISRHENENDKENDYIEKNDDKICSRNSLTNMINEYCDNDGLEYKNDLDENIQNKKMTMESFDSPKRNNYIDNNNNVNNFYENNNEINFSGEKTINSEKMNLNNEEILKLLNDEEQNNNEYEESQNSNNYIRSKNQSNRNNNISNNERKVNKSNKKDNMIKQKNINKLKEVKLRNNNKNKDNYKLKQKNKESKNNEKISETKNKENNIKKVEKENINVVNNKIMGKIPFHGSYIEYKEYEKYILDNNHDELLNNGNEEEDIFGKFVDNIIEKSYHVYTNRQCPSCANLLTNGKSCVNCPKYHHLIKNGKNKKIKNKK